MLVRRGMVCPEFEPWGQRGRRRGDFVIHPGVQPKAKTATTQETSVIVARSLVVVESSECCTGAVKLREVTKVLDQCPCWRETAVVVSMPIMAVVGGCSRRRPHEREIIHDRESTGQCGVFVRQMAFGVLVRTRRLGGGRWDDCGRQS